MPRRPACRCSWTRRSPSAGRTCRAAGRSSPEAPTSGAGPRASACSPSARAPGGARRCRADEREARRVPGFENVPAIVAAAAALEAYRADMAAEAPRISALVDRIRTEVPRDVPDVEVAGDPVRRLPHLVTFSCLYVEGEALLTELDRLGFAVSSGSSCTADTLRPSHVLEAMGVITHGNVRVSLPRGVRSEDVGRFLSVLPDAVARLRRTTMNTFETGRRSRP
ncbi:aminotransferase class V-fold PLP-dependent enzyme [Actinomadura madurae]|uniref:aminotransferase class V-fold PLP-dependent enzyme n=1 Tax=Actinomadura madurae TaxID=1993 RepID=UPI0020D25BEE|nr:aminotransferase class V-fold PLP-dependent enzyme [Actinomadura madurae]MCQ0004395.1 aminotransferase class V-fold PLP-dependent enzyme [Actinomadura madurae]